MTSRRRLVGLAVAAAAVALIGSCTSSHRPLTPPSASGASSPAPATFAVGTATTGGSTHRYPTIPAGSIHLCGVSTLSESSAVLHTPAQMSIARIAQDMINSQFGGIDGHLVSVDFTDDKASSSVAEQVVSRLATDHAQDPLKCPLVVSVSSNPTTASLEAVILNKAKIAVVDARTSDAFFDATKYPYVFSTAPSDAQLADAAAHYLLAHGLTRIAVLTNAIPQEGQYLADIKAAAVRQGGVLDFIKTVPLGIGATDAKAQLRQLRQAEPDVVLVATQYGYGAIWSSFQSIGWSPKIMGDAGFFYDGWRSLKGLAANAVAPCWGAQAPGDDIPAPVIDLINAITPFNGGFNDDPITQTISSIGQLLLAKYAIEKYHSVDPAAIRQALAGLNSTALPGWWDSVRYTYVGGTRLGLVGPYGAGVCVATPQGRVGNFATIVYADDYRASG